MNLRDINKKNLIYYINRKFARVNNGIFKMNRFILSNTKRTYEILKLDLDI